MSHQPFGGWTGRGPEMKRTWRRGEQCPPGSPRQSKIHCHFKGLNLRGLGRAKQQEMRRDPEGTRGRDHFLQPSQAGKARGHSAPPIHLMCTGVPVGPMHPLAEGAQGRGRPPRLHTKQARGQQGQYVQMFLQFSSLTVTVQVKYWASAPPWGTHFL